MITYQLVSGQAGGGSSMAQRKPNRDGAAHPFVPTHCDSSGRAAHANSFSFSSSLSFPHPAHRQRTVPPNEVHHADARCAARPYGAANTTLVHGPQASPHAAPATKRCGSYLHRYYSYSER